MNSIGNIDYIPEDNYSFVSDNIDIWCGDFPHKQGDQFPTDKIKNRADISKTNRMLFNNEYSNILNRLMDVMPEIDPMYGLQIKEIVANIPYFKTIVDAYVSLCCSPLPIIDTPDTVDTKLSGLIADSNLYSTLEYRFRSMFMDVIDVYIVKKNKQGKPFIQTVPVKNCVVYNDCDDITSIYCIEVFNINGGMIEFIDYFTDGRIEKRTFKYNNGVIGEAVGEVERTLAYDGKYKVSPAGFIRHNVSFPGDTYGVDQFRYWDSSITAVCRSFSNLFRLNEKCREIIRKIPESALSRAGGGYAFINRGTITYSDGLEHNQRPDIEYIIPELKNNIDAEIETLNKSIKLVSSSSGLSPVWFDFEKIGSNLSAKSLRAAMIPTILKANMLCDNMTEAIQDIVVKMALLYDINVSRMDIDIKWFGGITDEDDTVEYINKRLDNGTISKEDAIVYLDHIPRRVARERLSNLNKIPTRGIQLNIDNTDIKQENACKQTLGSIDISNIKVNNDTGDQVRNDINNNVIPDYQYPNYGA